MTKESKYYLEEANVFLNHFTGFRTNLTQLDKDIDNMPDGEGNPNTSKNLILNDYQRIYLKVYEEFQRGNFSGANNLPAQERRIKNTVMFNLVMDNLFENIIAKKYKNIYFEKDEYTFGGLDDEKFQAFNHRLSEKWGTNYYKEFTRKYDLENNPGENHFKDIRAGMKDVLKKIEAADSKDKLEGLIGEFAAGYAIMRNHYNNRSFFTQWLTPTGWQESSYLAHAQEKLVRALGPDMAEEFGILNLDSKNFDETMTDKGTRIEENESINVMDEKIRDYRFPVQEKGTEPKVNRSAIELDLETENLMKTPVLSKEELSHKEAKLYSLNEEKLDQDLKNMNLGNLPETFKENVKERITLEENAKKEPNIKKDGVDIAFDPLHMFHAQKSERIPYAIDLDSLDMNLEFNPVNMDFTDDLDLEFNEPEVLESNEIPILK